MPRNPVSLEDTQTDASISGFTRRITAHGFEALSKRMVGLEIDTGEQHDAYQIRG